MYEAGERKGVEETGVPGEDKMEQVQQDGRCCKWMGDEMEEYTKGKEKRIKGEWEKMEEM